jgi:hypothetical protein
VALESSDRASSGRDRGAGPRHRYCVYGIEVVSDVPLALPAYTDAGLGGVECASAPASFFERALQRAHLDPQSHSWYKHARLPDGSTYVRWATVGEFMVDADGRRITCRRIEESSVESFQVYMLGQALSFALVQQQLEPLHATVVVVDDRAVAFLGGSAFGKSSLAACFLNTGYRLLTDDLLIVQETSGVVLAYPGPPRIKLFPMVAGRFLGHPADGVPMNAETDKLILPLDVRRRCDRPVPLHTIYALAAPRDACRLPHVRIDALTSREAFIALMAGTFNRQHVSRGRSARQFGIMTGLTARVPIKRLTYPRSIERLPDVRAAVLADLAHGAPPVAVDRGAHEHGHEHDRPA